MTFRPPLCGFEIVFRDLFCLQLQPQAQLLEEHGVDGAQDIRQQVVFCLAQLAR